MKKKQLPPDYKQHLKYDICRIIRRFANDNPDIFEEQINGLRADMVEVIDEYEFEAEQLIKDPKFVEDFIYYLDADSHHLPKEHIETLCGIVESGPYKVIKCESLAEVMKVEQFMCELTENPYQLNLI